MPCAAPAFFLMAASFVQSAALMHSRSMSSWRFAVHRWPACPAQLPAAHFASCIRATACPSAALAWLACWSPSAAGLSCFLLLLCNVALGYKLIWPQKSRQPLAVNSSYPPASFLSLSVYHLRLHSQSARADKTTSLQSIAPCCFHPYNQSILIRSAPLITNFILAASN